MADKETPITGKEAIYIKIAEYVKDKTGKRIGKTGGREIFDTVINEVFAAAARDKAFRFNGGFGSMHIKEYKAGERRLPSRQITTFGIRHKLRYEEGVVVKALVENGGDLTEAIKARGSRVKKDAPAATEAEAATPTDEAAPAAAETEAVTPAADGDADLDLD